MFDDFNQCTGVPKTMDEEFIKKSTALFNHNFRILVHYLKSIDKTLVNELAILKTGSTIFDETKRRSFRRIMQTRRDTLSKLKKEGLRICWSTNENNAMWVHHAFLLQFIVRKVDVMLVENITKNVKLKKFLGVTSLDDCGGCLNLVVWNGRDSAPNHDDGNSFLI